MGLDSANDKMPAPCLGLIKLLIGYVRVYSIIPQVTPGESQRVSYVKDFVFVTGLMFLAACHGL